MPYPPLPKRVEYALKVLVCLAQCKGHPLRAQEVARCVHLSPAQAAKALYFLAWAGLVRSRRGSKGGFWLARTPERIRLQQVIAFFQRPHEKRPVPATDPLLRAWREAAERTHREWERLTLAELVRRTKANKTASPYVCLDTGQIIYAP